MQETERLIPSSRRGYASGMGDRLRGHLIKSGQRPMTRERSATAPVNLPLTGVGVDAHSLEDAAARRSGRAAYAHRG